MDKDIANLIEDEEAPDLLATQEIMKFGDKMSRLLQMPEFQAYQEILRERIENGRDRLEQTETTEEMLQIKWALSGYREALELPQIAIKAGLKAKETLKESKESEEDKDQNLT